MKILNVEDSDFDNDCGEWLIGNAELEFINGNYTHVCEEGYVYLMEKSSAGISVSEVLPDG